jgi:hypothetical protein
MFKDVDYWQSWYTMHTPTLVQGNGLYLLVWTMLLTCSIIKNVAFGGPYPLRTYVDLLRILRISSKSSWTGSMSN